MLQNLRIVPSIALSALFLLVTAHQTPAAAQTANPHLNGIPAAPSCNTGHGGQNCKQHQNLQLCLKGTPGTKGRHWICLYNRDKKWVPAGGGTKARAEQALAWEKQNASAPPPPPAAPLTAAPHMPPAGAPGTPPGAAQTGNPHLGGIPAAASCAGSDCSQNPNRQLCLKGTPGAERKHKICMYERGHRWVPAGGGTKARADRALSWEQQNASAPPPPPAAPPTAAPHMPPGAPSGPPPGAPPTAAAQTGNPHLNGIPAAASCNTGHGGQNCKQHPNLQLCLKGTPGTKGRHWICMHDRGSKWVPAGGATKRMADQALAWEKQPAEWVADVFRIAHDISTQHRGYWGSMAGVCPEAYSSGKYTDHLPPAQETKAAALCLCKVIDERLNLHEPPHPHAYKHHRRINALEEWGVIYTGRPQDIPGIQLPVPMYKSCVDLGSR